MVYIYSTQHKKLFQRNTFVFYYSFVFFVAYVSNIYDTLTKTPRQELKKIEEELKEENPGPLHAMLPEKQTREEAIELFRSRKRKITSDCPHTCTGTVGYIMMV